MNSNRIQTDPSHDDEYWSIVAEFLDRRDRGESLDPDAFARGNPVLAKRLQDCLAGFGWLEQALSGSSGESLRDAQQAIPESIGDYNVVRELGRGGMGVVYEAVHQSLGRRVALKVLFDPSLRGATARERFLREAKTAASLHHTNIVPVFDVGTANGHLYFAMQLIDGGSLEQFASQQRGSASLQPAEPSSPPQPSASPTPLDPCRVARIGLQAAEALAYAHAHGVVHRDIKPSNLLLDSSDVLWIADFGLSRRPSDASVTATGARVGTPRYMSPEQATAQWDALDARTDIYSLGVTLYELLTGRPVFAESTPPQLLFQIIRSEPPTLRSTNPRIPRDLETIVLKAMAKRPADRYSSAQHLADDLRRFIGDEPIHARRIGPAGRMIRWCRREPLVALVTAVALLSLTTVVAAYQIRLTNQRDAAIDAANESRLQLGDALFERARAVRATQLTGRLWESLDLLKQSTAIRNRSELSVEATRTLQLYDARPLGAVADLSGKVGAVAIDRVTNCIAAALDSSAGSSVVVWDPKSQSVTHLLPTTAPVHSIAFSPDGTQLAGASERHICVWKLSSRALQIMPGGAPGLSTVAFNADGSRLFGFGSSLCEWDVRAGALVSRILDQSVEVGHVAVTGTGRVLAAVTASDDEVPLSIRRWSLPDLQPLAPLESAEVRPDRLSTAIGIIALAASPRGDQIAASSGDSRIRLWDGAAAKPIGVMEGHRVPAVALAFAPNGDTLVSSDGFEVKLWDVRTCAELATLLRPESFEAGPISSIAFGDNGMLATASNECRLWEIAQPRFYRLVARQPEVVRSVTASPDGRWLAWINGAQLRIWDRSDDSVRHDVAVAATGDASLAFTSDGRLIAVASAGMNRIRLIESATGLNYADLPSQPATAIAASPNANEIAAAHSDGVIRRWNVATRQVAAAYVGHVGPVTNIAFNCDGSLLAASNQDAGTSNHHTLHLWEIASGRLVRSWKAHRSAAFAVAFSPDGQRLASCGNDRTVELWQVSDGEHLGSFTGQTHPAMSVTFSPDGATLAAASLDGHVFLWDGNSRRLIADFASRASGALNHVTFSRDGRWVFAAGGPYRWTHRSPGAIEEWDVHELRSELGQLGIAWGQ